MSVSKIIELKEQMLNNSRRHYDRWKDNKERHLVTKKNEAIRKEMGLSNLRIPFELAYVEAKCSNEMETLPFVQVAPTEPTDNKYATQFQTVLDYVCDNVLNLNEKLYRMHIPKNVYGDAFLKVYYKKDERTVSCPIVKGKGKDKYIDYKKKSVCFYDDIAIDVLDPRQVLIDPICFQPSKTIDDASMCGFIYIYDIEYVKKVFTTEAGYKNIDKVQPVVTHSSGSVATKEETQSINTGGNDRMVEIYEHWDLLNDKVTFIAGDSVIIKETPIPYYNPITNVKMLPIAHFIGHYLGDGFFNFGEIDLVKELAEERQTMRNINLDAGKTTTMPFIVKPIDMDMETDGFRLGYNHIMEAENPEQLKVIQLSGNSVLPFSLENANQADAVMATGHDISNVVSGKSETATRTLSVKESEVARTRYTTYLNERNGYRRLYNLIKNMVLQFYDDETLERILGEEPVFKVEGEKGVLEKDYDILITTNNQLPASKEIAKLRKQEALGVLSTLPFNPQTGELPEYLKPVVRDLLGDMYIDTTDYPNIFAPKEIEEQSEISPEDQQMQQTLDEFKGMGLDAGSVEEFNQPSANDPFNELLKQAGAGEFIKPANAPKGMEMGNQSEVQTFVQGSKY